MVDIDDDLLCKAMEHLGTRTKRDTVNAALREVVERQARLELLDFLDGMDLDLLKDRDSFWQRS